MISALSARSKQIPFFHIIHADDLELLKDADVDWFRLLYYLRWEYYLGSGAKYYNALYEFNIEAAQRKKEMMKAFGVEEIETKEDARQRLLFGRDTMKKLQGKKRVNIYQGEEIKPFSETVRPMNISPGVVPSRDGGKKPKCFFALLKSFLGVSLMGYSPTPEEVHSQLKNNPSFIRVCGFVPKRANDEYCYRHMPSLRKLEQFDEIMTKAGIWGEIKLKEVKTNIREEIIRMEKELVGDTTHYYAYSGFETVKYKDEKGKEQRKSQSKLTKRCRCEDRLTCRHGWELADDGAGTVVKSLKKMYWAHKASVIGFPGQGIPLDAAAVSDASANDGQTFFPHVERLLEQLPEIKDIVKRVLYDSACDDKALKEKFKKDLNLELKSSMNPRRRKDVTKDLPRGIEKITPYGVPVCRAGYEMDYQGMRIKEEKFIYQAPRDEYDIPACLKCTYQKECCPNAMMTGRTINISFDILPQIDPNDPSMAKRFKAIMARRPSVERMIKRLKCDLGDDRLTKRGNASFQAYLDKTMIAFHILLRQQHEEFKDSS